MNFVDRSETIPRTPVTNAEPARGGMLVLRKPENRRRHRVVAEYRCLLCALLCNSPQQRAPSDVRSTILT